MNNGMTRHRRQGRRDFGSIYTDGTPTAPRFSVMWWEGGTRHRKRGFGSRTEAAAFLATVRAELANGTRKVVTLASRDVTVEQAIKEYETHRREKGNKPGSLQDTTYRLRAFFTDTEMRLAALKPEKCAAYYDALCSRTTRTGQPFAVDSHRNILAESKSLLKFCIGRRWLARNPLEGVEGKGRRRHGKPQLRIDEARRWMAKAVELADEGDVGAVAAMMALLLGMRAHEIVSRVVRDLDDEGRLLWIPHSKTEAGRRTLRVPEVLRGYLRALTAGRPPEALIFGERWRDYPRKAVQRICKAAEVPHVSAHSMRGLHSTLAMEAGVTGAVVAASLGHENVTTTVQSYAKPEAVATAQQARVLSVLDGGKLAAAG